MAAKSASKLLTNGLAVTASTTVFSDSFDASLFTSMSFHVIQAGGATTAGVGTVQHSNDNSNWEDTTTTFTFAQTLNSLKQISPAGAGFYRMKIAPTTANITSITVKALGKAGI